MKCPNCEFENNKPDAKVCKKCGQSLVVIPVWRPNWVWHIKVLVIIYIILVILFFVLNYFLKPYMRELPKEIVPWIEKKK